MCACIVMQIFWLFSMFRTRKGMLKGNAFFDLITWAMTFINSQTQLWIALLSLSLCSLCVCCVLGKTRPSIEQLRLDNFTLGILLQLSMVSKIKIENT